jgi:hypothetical protein
MFEQQQQQAGVGSMPGQSVGLMQDSNQLPSQLILRGLPGQAAAAAGSSQPSQASFAVSNAGMTAAALANLLAVASLSPTGGDGAKKQSGSGAGKHSNAGPAKQHLLYKVRRVMCQD